MGPGERGLKRLIVTGDDFGLSLPVNEAIEIAHTQGILTTTCLMVGAPEAANAIERARRLPGLGVGLHIVVVRGRPVLPPAAVPDLVDGDGGFDTDLVRAGFRFFFLPRVRTQLAAEIRAQFEAFRDSGLVLDHVNAHNHMHLHPTVLGLILKIGGAYGLRAVRLPFEPLVRAGGRWGGGILPRLIRRSFLVPWVALMKWRLRSAGIRCNDYVFGIHDCGRMDRDRLLAVLGRLPDGVSEVFCHPAARPWRDVDPTAERYRFEDEFNALIDPDVRAAVARSGAQLIAFRDL